MKQSTATNDANQEKWIDKQDILMRMCISERTLFTWRKSNLIPFARIGKKIYYREADLLALLEKNISNGK